MKRDTELLKIQVYVGYCDSHFRVLISFVLGASVAVVVALMGLFLQNKIDAVTYYVVILLFVVPFFAFFVWHNYRDYRESLSKVDSMIECVNNGKVLPSVKDMLKGKT